VVQASGLHSPGRRDACTTNKTSTPGDYLHAYA
jgi:hypothetical protein